MFVMWFDTTLSSIIPIIVVFVANVRIIMELKMKKKKKKSQTIRVHREAESKEEKRVTVMLLVMTCSFLVFLMPLFVWNLHRYFSLKNGSNPKATAISHLVMVVCVQLLYTNNAVNFYLYVVFGRDFRKELRRMFTKNRVHSFTREE